MALTAAPEPKRGYGRHPPPELAGPGRTVVRSVGVIAEPCGLQ
jgi:hypothetical protein